MIESQDSFHSGYWVDCPKGSTDPVRSVDECGIMYQPDNLTMQFIVKKNWVEVREVEVGGHVMSCSP